MTKKDMEKQIKEIVFRYFMPKVEAEAKTPNEKVFAKYATLIIQEQLKSKEIELFIDELVTLFQSATHKTEKRMIKKLELAFTTYYVDEHDCKDEGCKEIELQEDYVMKYMKKLLNHSKQG